MDKITSLRQCFIISFSDYLRAKFPNSVCIFTCMFILISLTWISIVFHSQWQQLWIASCVVFQSQWRKFLQLFGEDDYYLYVWGKFFGRKISFLYHRRLWELSDPLCFVGCVLSIQVPFWGVGSIFVFMDYYNWPKWILKYKIQPGTNEPVDLRKVIQVKPLRNMYVG